MKTKKILQFDPSTIQSRLGLCAAALAGTAAAVPSADATIVTFNTPIAVPNTFAGIYINLQNGTSGGNTTPGWDFNPYGTTQLDFFWAAGAGGVAATTATGPYLDLAVGTVVGPGSTYSIDNTGTTGSPFLTTGTHILGFEFNNGGVTDYGYLTMSNTAANGATTSSRSTIKHYTAPNIPNNPPGFPATVMSWSFDDTGAPITVVPEPSTAALLTISALAAGALGLRKWRRQRAA
jgi:hypothetical protein